MKKMLQIVQKCIFPSMIVVFGMLFIYGLIFATPVRTLVLYILESSGNIIGANPDKGIEGSSTILKFLGQFPDALTIVRQTNYFSNSCLVFAIIGLILTGICFLLRSNIRKKYYWTNFIGVGALGLYSAGIGGFCLFYLTRYLLTLTGMDLVALNEKIPSYLHYPAVEGFGIIHILGYIIMLAMIVFSFILLILFVIKLIIRVIKIMLTIFVVKHHVDAR